MNGVHCFWEVHLPKMYRCSPSVVSLIFFLQNLRFNVCTTMTLLSMGAGWFNNQSPIYAYLQKAALTLRLILEALPIPSRRHRLRVWVTYLSIKVLLRRSPGWVSSFFHKILTTLILNLFPYLRSCHLGFQLLNISTQCQFIQQSLLTSLPLSPSTSWPPSCLFSWPPSLTPYSTLSKIIFLTTFLTTILNTILINIPNTMFNSSLNTISHTTTFFLSVDKDFPNVMCYSETGFTMMHYYSLDI